MAVSQTTKDFMASDVWASNAGALRADPEDFGLVRETGWPQPYEQKGTGKEPELEVFNQLDHELDAALHDCLFYGILPWDAEVNYPHTDEERAFVVTPNGLHVSLQASGPATGNPTDPDEASQQVWRRY